MALTGHSLLLLLGAITVGVPLAAALLLPRWRLPRRLAAPTRFAAVVAGQLAAVLLVAAALNDYAYFYGSWSEVTSSVAQAFGASPAHSRIAAAPGTAASGVHPAPRAGVRVLGSRRGHVSPARWTIGGRLEQVVIRGASSGLRTRAYVYLPPQYFRSRDAHTTFPGVEVLSGYPSTDAMLVRRLGLPHVLLHEIEHRLARPMVLVMMRPTLTYPRDTECTDVPAGPQAETFYAQDVPAAISSAFRVAPSGWGAAGVSTGGYCATKLTMDHPATFRAGASLSGYYHALRDYTTGDLWGGSPVVRDLNSPEWRLAHQPAPDVSLLVTVSRDEAGPLGYRDTRRFLSLVHPPMRVSTILLAHGTHTFSTWKPLVPEALRWLSRRIGPQQVVSAGATPAGRLPAASGRSVRALPHRDGPRLRPAAG